MNYLSFTFRNAEDWQLDLLIVALDAVGFQGYEEKPGELVACIPADLWDEANFHAAIDPLMELYAIKYERESIAERNWNEEWEKGFRPIVIGAEIAVRASFHPPFPDVKYDIVIDPKMSFGTGHHATTEMMMRLMLREAFDGRQVLDFGSGTGILSVLASKLHAETILSVDHESWAYQNSIDNFRTNNIHNVTPLLADAAGFHGRQFDIILANISRSVITATMTQFATALRSHGKLLISGFLQDDEVAILEAAHAAGFQNTDQLLLDGWKAISLFKLS